MRFIKVKEIMILFRILFFSSVQLLWQEYNDENQKSKIIGNRSSFSEQIICRPKIIAGTN